MLAEIVRGGKSIVQLQPVIHALRHLIGGKHLAAGAIGPNRKTPGKQQNQPIPVQNLRTDKKQQNRATECKRG